jgi:hypothetical protein
MFCVTKVYVTREWKEDSGGGGAVPHQALLSRAEYTADNGGSRVGSGIHGNCTHEVPQVLNNRHRAY